MRCRKKAELPTAFLRCFKPYSANPKVRAVRVSLDIISCTRSCSCCQAAKYVKGLATVLAPGAPCLIVGKPRCGKQNGRNHLSGNSTQKHERSESTIYICILYLWTCKMGILCFEPSGLKNCLVGNLWHQISDDGDGNGIVW